MTQGWGVFGGFLVFIVVAGALTGFVRSVVRRSSAPVLRRGTRDGVLFVVNSRRWQRIMLRTIGIVSVAVGAVTFLIQFSPDTVDRGLGGGIAGVVLVVLGLWLVWAAHSWACTRLEVTDDAVWVFRAVRAPRCVALSEVTRLTAISSNQYGGYGGVVARRGRERLFSATRLMVGYRELIDHIHTQRPDLDIPDDAWPL